MLTDIEIAQQADLKNITDILPEYKDIIEPYGKHMAKISYEHINDDKVKQSNLILVTAITPTKAGIGKTTVSIGLNDALNQLGKKAIAALREPSLGPCFGMKGGACGGGYSQVIPMEKINLHFTGDFHAITTANNMIAAALDNYLYQNKIAVKKILFKRCLDINDRSLRNISYKIRQKDVDIVNTGFNITPASELMAIFCLATDIEDLRRRIGQIILAECYGGIYLYASELNITGSIVALLSEAFKPNLVQTLAHNPVIIHGGPFANIAHGCNSIVGTKLAMSLSDYVVTEAGFGSDLGAEKFWDIKCRTANITPKCVVLVVTIPGLKNLGGTVSNGCLNMYQHYKSLSSYGFNVIVTCNTYTTDTNNEFNELSSFCNEHNIKIVKNNCFTEGSKGALALAQEVINIIDNQEFNKNNYSYNYYLRDSLSDKIKNILTNVYGYPDNVELVIDNREVYNKFYFEIGDNIEFLSYPVCIAKTQYSLSDNANINPTIPSDNSKFYITDIEVNNGAEMIIVSAGNMMRMPGLPKKPQAEVIDFIDNKITGLS